jgi:hypothetical protein
MRTLILAAFSFVIAGSALAQDVLTGDKRLACEAVLCLASGTRPSECSKSLQKYFSIKFRKPGKTLNARKQFLSLCPRGNDEAKIEAAVDRATNASQQCDAVTLNSTLTYLDPSGVYAVDNELPEFCLGNPSSARYVGSPLASGFWAPAADYDRLLGEYSRAQR